MGLHRLAACAGCGRQFDLGADPARAVLPPGASFPCSCGGTVTVPAVRAEEAAVVACSSCGGPRHGREPACRWCGAAFTVDELELDAICPRCAARVRRRGRFCHGCALPLTAPDEPVPTDYPCPTCLGADGRERPLLVSRRVGEGDPLHLFECRRCAGMWLDREVFRALVERARRERSGLPPERFADRSAALERDWSYRPCPACGALMARRNYARRSGVLLDVCHRHGVWFDRDELARVLDWVRRGGATDVEMPAAQPPRSPPVQTGDRALDGGSDPWRGSQTLGDVLVDVAFALGRALFGR